MLPQHLIVDFWETVKQELLQRHGLSEADAVRAIASYRAALDRHDVGEWIYHRDPEPVAETIARGWTYGFPDPQTGTPG